MRLVTQRAVEIALRTLSKDELRQVTSWFDHLKNWDNDPHIQKISHRLPNQDIYVLSTSDGIRIFFRKEADTVTILDIARKETIRQFADAE